MKKVGARRLIADAN